jgi:hypothetical protein
VAVPVLRRTHESGIFERVPDLRCISAQLTKTGISPAPTSGTAFSGGNNAPTNVREEIIRIDHHFNDKFWIFGHWVDKAISQTYGTSMGSGDNVPTASNTFGNPSYSGVVHAIYTVSPTVLNEVALNYNGKATQALGVSNFQFFNSVNALVAQGVNSGRDRVGRVNRLEHSFRRCVYC